MNIKKININGHAKQGGTNIIEGTLPRI